MKIDTERVHRRVAARNEAGEILALAISTAKEMTSEAATVFWEAIRNEAIDHAPLAPAPTPAAPVVPMTDMEADEFGSQKMPFGKWAGSLIENVPLRYLDWLVGQPDVFKNDVTRYLHNPKIAEALADELEGNGE